MYQVQPSQESRCFMMPDTLCADMRRCTGLFVLPGVIIAFPGGLISSGLDLSLSVVSVAKCLWSKCGHVEFASGRRAPM